jgi:hypothetical protein
MAIRHSGSPPARAERSRAGLGSAFDQFGLTFKVKEFMTESHPGVPRRLPYRYRRPGHRRIGERAKGDADKARERFRVPENRGTAVGAEMLFDLAPRVAAAHVDLTLPFGAHLLFREIDADAKGRASTALALRAMTHSQKRRLAGRLRAQRAAATMCDPARPKPLWRQAGLAPSFL